MDNGLKTGVNESGKGAGKCFMKLPPLQGPHHEKPYLIICRNQSVYARICGDMPRLVFNKLGKLIGADHALIT